jgi:short subunit dehydrogenase-like uncharacterized protein
VSRRIVVYGASGFTGSLVAEALVKARARPVLAGRSHQNLAALGVVLGKGLDIAVASPAAPGSVVEILQPGDVLVNTAGPFGRIGRPVLEAAIIRGAAYIDSCGEPSFIRAALEDYQGHAEEAKVAVVSGAAYEFAAGDVAATLALQPVQDRATRLDVGYFFLGRRRGAFTPGTLASVGSEALRPHHAWRDGALVPAKAGDRVRTFTAAGESHAGIAIGGPEHFWIPRRFPALAEVNVYLGSVRSERAARLAGRAIAVGSAVPGMPAVVSRIAARPRTSPGPSPELRAATGCMVTATAFAEDGAELHTVTLRGANAYTVTSQLMAWEALTLQRDWSERSGVLSPVEVFGLEPLQDALAQAGLPLVEER